jgi:hypothetical protein
MFYVNYVVNKKVCFMKKFLPILIFLLALMSCKENNKQTEVQTDSTAFNQPGTQPLSVTDSLLQGCYSYINNRDTASLQLGMDKGNLSGSLSYNLEGKDHNDGTFQGEIRGDRLELWYLFRSEGVMSVRQEIFKILPGKLVPANGTVTVRNDTALFTDPSRVSFDTTRAFVKVPCVI